MKIEQQGAAVAVADGSIQATGTDSEIYALAGAGLVRSLDPEDVATFEVQPGRFVREVEGRGSLKAVKAAPILAPVESGRPQKISFLARDGAVVEEGETIVEFDPYDALKEEADGLIVTDARGSGSTRDISDLGENFLLLFQCLLKFLSCHTGYHERKLLGHLDHVLLQCKRCVRQLH